MLDLDHQRSAVVVAAPSRATRSVPLLAGAFIRGMHAAGMAATGKRISRSRLGRADSHVAIPEDARSLGKSGAATWFRSPAWPDSSTR